MYSYYQIDFSQIHDITTYYKEGIMQLNHGFLYQGFRLAPIQLEQLYQYAFVKLLIQVERVCNEQSDNEQFIRHMFPIIKVAQKLDKVNSVQYGNLLQCTDILFQCNCLWWDDNGRLQGQAPSLQTILDWQFMTNCFAAQLEEGVTPLIGVQVIQDLVAVLPLPGYIMPLYIFNADYDNNSSDKLSETSSDKSSSASSDR